MDPARVGKKPGKKVYFKNGLLASVWAAVAVVRCASYDLWWLSPFPVHSGQDSVKTISSGSGLCNISGSTTTMGATPKAQRVLEKKIAQSSNALSKWFTRFVVLVLVGVTCLWLDNIKVCTI